MKQAWTSGVAAAALLGCISLALAQGAGGAGSSGSGSGTGGAGATGTGGAASGTAGAAGTSSGTSGSSSTRGTGSQELGQMPSGQTQSSQTGAGQTGAGGSAGGGITLSQDESTKLKTSIQRVNVKEATNINIDVREGTILPATVTGELEPVPQEIVQIVPRFRDYRVVKVKGKILVVEPQTRRVVYIIQS